MNKAFIGIIIISLLLLTPSIVFAVNETSSASGDGDVYNVVLQESLKTRTELKAYFDQKFQKWLGEATLKAQGFLDENFAQIDHMIKSEVQKYYIKIIIGLVAALVFAEMLVYFIIMSIRRLINRKQISERKVVLEWLESHEKETVVMKETIVEMKGFIELLKRIKKQPDDDVVPKPPETGQTSIIISNLDERLVNGEKALKQHERGVN